MKRKIKAVLFDIDGSLIDSQMALYYMFKDSLEVFEENNKTKKEILKPMGSSSKAWIKKLVPRINKEKLKEMRNWIAYEYAKHYMKRFAKPMKYVPYILKELKKNDIQIGVVTNQHDNQAEVSLQIMRFRKFDVIITSDHVKNPKPSPEPLLHALKKLKLKKNEVIYIGDTRPDLKSGKAAGIKTYLVNHSYNKHFKCKRIKTLKEVLKLIL